MKYTFMKKLPFITFVLLGFLSFSQEMDCNDFKNGSYKAIMIEPIKIEWQIIRNGNEQIEKIIELPDELKDLNYPTDPLYVTIEWISDCSYKALYDETKSELTESQKLVNNMGGIITEITNIDGNCYDYRTIMKVGETEQILNGRMCKE